MRTFFYCGQAGLGQVTIDRANTVTATTDPASWPVGKVIADGAKQLRACGWRQDRGGRKVTQYDAFGRKI